jgi:hypothetical protein
MIRRDRVTHFDGKSEVDWPTLFLGRKHLCDDRPMECLNNGLMPVRNGIEVMLYLNFNLT